MKMTQMQHRIINLISKHPSDRRDVEIKIVLPWIRKKSNLFKDLDKDVLSDVLRNCAYRKAYKDDVLIAQGEKGDSFYIMLTGKTSVFIDTQKSDDEAPPETSTEELDNVESAAQNSDLTELLEKTELPTKKKSLDRSKYGKFIIHYEEGKSFGEVALMSDDSVRNATVIADDETDLLVISRELFNRSMKTKQEEEYRERKEFIRRSPYFSNWTIKFKRLLEMSIHKEFYPFGTVIVRQGDPPPGMLFILSGQAKLIMNPAHHKHQFSKILKTVDPVEAELKRQKQQKQQLREEQEYAQPQIRVRMKEGYAAAEKRHRDKEIELCCVEVNDVIGDVEMALELDKCLSTVVCTANTVAMVLDSKNYDRLVAKKNVHTVHKICQKALQKIAFRSKTTKGTGIPILRRLQEKLRERLPKVVEQTVIRKEITEMDKQRSVLMEQLVEFFIQGKTPMIEPFVPNALYYRKKSAKRAEMIEHMKARKLGLQSGALRRSLYEKPKGRVARSLKQLQKANAESELLGPYRNYDRQISAYSNGYSSALVQRPKTSIGISSSMRNGVEQVRPRTADNGASRFFMTECELSDNPVKADDMDMFEQMSLLQREKNETRSKIVCSATARAELDLRTLNPGNMRYDEDYFDWETGDSHLQNLEDKIKTFCQKIENKSYTNSEPRVSSLRRFHIKDERDENTYEIKVPKPGGTVFIKARLCDNHLNEENDDEHQHVRRFIVTRETASAQDAVRQERPKSAIVSRSSVSSNSTVRKRPKTAVNRTQ